MMTQLVTYSISKFLDSIKNKIRRFTEIEPYINKYEKEKADYFPNLSRGMNGRNVFCL